MRNWNVNPRKMCGKHLRGEHCECHMFIGTIKKKKKLNGYIDKGLVEVHNIAKRHDQLAVEMLRRGYKHATRILAKDKKLLYKAGEIDSSKNILELCRRCRDCRKLLK